MDPRSREAFTLIELLVVIAIIAILAVVVVLTLNPAQLLAQSRDANRVSDMATLNSATNLYMTDQTGASGFSLGTSTNIYVSVADSSSTCGNLGLPAAPSGYSYACASSTSSRNVNGTGWIPIKFTSTSAGSPFGALPVDPTNQTSSGLYYIYSASSSQFMVAGTPESTKQKQALANNPIIPNYPDVIANGNGLTISPLYNTSGLVGYYTFDEGSGSSAADASGNGNVGTWGGTGTHYSTAAKIGSYAGSFNGSNDYINITAIPMTSLGNGFTWSAWVKTTNFSGGWSWPFAASASAGGFAQCGKKSGSGDIRFDQTSGLFYSGSLADTSGSNIADGNWHLLTCTWDTVNRYIYVDGVLRASTASVVGTNQSGYGNVQLGAHNGPSEWWNGLLDDVRIYNRALSASEVAALYNAGK